MADVNEKSEAGGENVKEFRLSEVKAHNDAKSCYLVVHNKVYDVTRFLEEVSLFTAKPTLFSRSCLYIIYLPFV